MSYRTTVSIDVDLDEFDDEAILEAAEAIIARHIQTEEPTQDGWPYKRWSQIGRHVSEIAKLLGMEHADLPPASSAARIKSPEQLRNILATDPLFGGKAPEKAA